MYIYGVMRVQHLLFFEKEWWWGDLGMEKCAKRVFYALSTFPKCFEMFESKSREKLDEIWDCVQLNTISYSFRMNLKLYSQRFNVL